MIEDGVQRRLSAVLAADVAGYTRLMEEDTDGTVAAWRTARADIVDPSVANHGGRLVKLTGDGFLAEFTSVLDAVNCAIAMQGKLAESSLDFRMGVNLGDVVDDGEDIHGEGVNIAARIEALADPGGICISGMVHDSVRNRLDHRFGDLGEYEVKHVSSPVRVYRVELEELSGKPERAVIASAASVDKPSIAVLPFDNMSGDEDQEYFADGITEDVITALSQFHWLFVIARNSTFSYKGTAPDVRQVGEELGVKYVLEGSVRKAGSRVRVTGQLIEATTGNHIWAEKYDREMADVFDLQDELTSTIVGKIEPEIGHAERMRAVNKPTENLTAWDLYQRGLWHFWRYGPDNIAKAKDYCQQAVDLDPEFALAYARLAWIAYVESMTLLPPERDAVVVRGVSDARTGLRLDGNDATCATALGLALLAAREHDESILQFRRAIKLNPNFAQAYYGLSMSMTLSLGDLDEAMQAVDRAIELSPKDPMMFVFLHGRGMLRYLSGDFEGALAEMTESVSYSPGLSWPYSAMVWCLAELGRDEDAAKAAERLKKKFPDLNVGSMKEFIGPKISKEIGGYFETLIKYGVAE